LIDVCIPIPLEVMASVTWIEEGALEELQYWQVDLNLTYKKQKKIDRAVWIVCSGRKFVKETWKGVKWIEQRGTNR
jgi:hypothetical protein